MAAQASVAIIGAGPSGLVFARLLEQNGIADYVVFERDPSAVPGPGQQGGTLDLHGSSGQLALKRCGLFEAFNNTARWNGSCVHVMSPKGKTIIQHAEPADSPRAKPEIDRVQLRELLLKAIPAEKIRWGHAIKTVERNSDRENDNGCVIHFTNGTSATGFKLIVGADGAWSKVRPLLSSAQPIYSGKMFLEGQISHNNPTYTDAREIAGPGNAMAVGGHKMLAIQQVADRTYRTNFGLVVPEDFYRSRGCADTREQNEKSEAVRELLLCSVEYFSSWDTRLKSFVEHTEGPFRAWPLYYLRPEEVCWERSVAPGVTLLGDAAHLTTPFVGEGVNCSMYDAVVLAERIFKYCGGIFRSENSSFAGVDGSELEVALAAYEKDMFARGQDLIRRSAESEKTLFAEDAADKFLVFITDARRTSRLHEKTTKEQQSKGAK